MALRIGSPAEGEDFFERDVERAQLWRVLPGNHVVPSAPRRLGKTSLLKQLLREAEGHGLLPTYLDVDFRVVA
jgi:predicted AAA+ superfamily ATPase